jgi:hypothetical protein
LPCEEKNGEKIFEKIFWIDIVFLGFLLSILRRLRGDLILT